MKTAIPDKFKKNNNFWVKKHKIQKNIQKEKKTKKGLRYESPSGNKVDGLPLALNKIYKKMYNINEILIEKSVANYRKVASY